MAVDKKQATKDKVRALLESVSDEVITSRIATRNAVKAARINIDPRSAGKIRTDIARERGLLEGKKSKASASIPNQRKATNQPVATLLDRVKVAKNAIALCGGIDNLQEAIAVVAIAQS